MIFFPWLGGARPSPLSSRPRNYRLAAVVFHPAGNFTCLITHDSTNAMRIGQQVIAQTRLGKSLTPQEHPYPFDVGFQVLHIPKVKRCAEGLHPGTGWQWLGAAQALQLLAKRFCTFASICGCASRKLCASRRGPGRIRRPGEGRMKEQFVDCRWPLL